ncbi:MBL fold metallo-hydrolase [Aquimarina sp. MMG016]|uniref:MBL fold metallo-hydrolase n=1 Tax=Aquimarina sp. MMG016 TaxID=2822690 RepID=UPI001B3A6D41|nr:MBL fold metallo-hydrolase [Aquimarina sp. MMG016]MBQ4820204.1 MBL fold metallo-hydrolase [Aquimarina sp. MMG016]
MQTNRLHFLILCLALLINQGCTMVKVKISEKRNPIPQKVTIGENITLTTWGAIKVNKSHFFPSSFQLKIDDKVIYIDPVGIENAEQADYILITHAHPDHFSLKDIKNLLKDETIIICSKGALNKIRDVKNQIQIVKPKEQLQFEKIGIETTLAYNTKSVFLWIKAHSKSKENVGYVITSKNGLKIYHAGDTDYISEMERLSGIDVALVPIGGDNLTMNAEEAAKIVNKIRPKIAIPMHYEIKNQEELNRFDTLVNEKTKVIKLRK